MEQNKTWGSPVLGAVAASRERVAAGWTRVMAMAEDGP